MKKALLISFAILFTVSCDRYQEPLQDFDIVFIGSWSSQDYYLEIGANGYGFCQRRNREPIEGTVEIRWDEIEFFGNGRSERFYIDAEPFEEFGEVMMILDGDYFYRH